MHAKARVVAASLLAALAFSACSSSSSKTSTTTTTTPERRAAPTSFAGLAARIVTEVPPGFALYREVVGETGPYDLAAAAKHDHDLSPNAATALRAEGFVRGYQRLWVGGPASAQIIAFVYQFKSSAGAEQDFARATKRLSDPLLEAEKFAVEGLPASESAGASTAKLGTRVSVVYFTTGVFNVWINCNASAREKIDLQARATSIAQDQFARLNR